MVATRLLLKNLNKAQQMYSAYDRELLATYESVKYYRDKIEGRHFTIFTDHKPIIYVYLQRDRQCSPRQFNHLDFISQFTTDTKTHTWKVQHRNRHIVQNRSRHRHIPGSQNFIYCDTSLSSPRPYVPTGLRRQIFNSTHSMSHPGAKVKQS